MTDWRKFPPVHHPPRDPDIVLMPYPHTLVCPGCGLTRNLPNGWQKMLKSDTLTCVECARVIDRAGGRVIAYCHPDDYDAVHFESDRITRWVEDTQHPRGKVTFASEPAMRWAELTDPLMVSESNLDGLQRGWG